MLSLRVEMRQGGWPGWLTTGGPGKETEPFICCTRPGSGRGRGSCREGSTTYCLGQAPRQTSDNPQNKLRNKTQGSSSTIGLHMYYVYTIEISRQKAFIPSSGVCLFLGIRGQNRTTRKGSTHICILNRLLAQCTSTYHIEHEKSLVLAFPLH